jgi:hypothetical protein
MLIINVDKLLEELEKLDTHIYKPQCNPEPVKLTVATFKELLRKSIQNDSEPRTPYSIKR